MFAVLILLLLVAPVSAQDWWDDDVLIVGVDDEPAPDLSGPEIRDPFFEFCIGLIEADSLGVWTRDELASAVAATDRPTSLPLEHVVRMSRRKIPPGVRRIQRFAVGSRELVLELDADLSLPLPFSILGYHPGDLHVARTVRLTEWYAGSHGIRLAKGRDDHPYEIGTRDLRALTVDDGWIVLDVDGWLDRLMGRKLDDTWIEALVLGRVDRADDARDLGLHGMALGRARGGRALAGSFDFRRNKVLPNGQPVARAFSNVLRPVLAPYEEAKDSRAWDWPRGR